MYKSIFWKLYIKIWWKKWKLIYEYIVKMKHTCSFNPADAVGRSSRDSVNEEAREKR